MANNSLSRTDRAADEWPAQCLPTISPPINSPALKLCHERASDHWPYLVRPLGGGLSFSAHRRCDRAATKRSSASTFTHWRHCLIIGRRILVFMISTAKVSTSDDIVVPVYHAIADGRRSCPVAIRSHSWFAEGRIVAEWERTGCSWEQGTAGERGVGSQSWAVNCMQLSLQETETEAH